MGKPIRLIKRDRGMKECSKMSYSRNSITLQQMNIEIPAWLNAFRNKMSIKTIVEYGDNVFVYRIWTAQPTWMS